MSEVPPLIRGDVTGDPNPRWEVRYRIGDEAQHRVLATADTLDGAIALAVAFRKQPDGRVTWLHDREEQPAGRVS